MHAKARHYLQRYTRQLTTTTAARHVHGKTADWIWRNKADVGRVVLELNRGLALRDKKQFQNHIPTLAVGALNGLVFVSANPGYSAKANAHERRYREASANQNRKFCSDVFRELRRYGSSAWWTRALKFGYCVETGRKYPVGIPSKHFWEWARGIGPLAAHGQAAVGNVDLIPFHSTSDGFGSMSGSSSASRELRALAVATLKCLLTIEPAPRLIFIASSSGLKLLEAESKAFELDLEKAAPDAPFGELFRVYTHQASGRKVAVFGRQIFAANFSLNKPQGFTWDVLAGLLRPLADPPYPSLEFASGGLLRSAPARGNRRCGHCAFDEHGA